MRVVHIAFTYLRLTLIYFYLECKILEKIPDSVFRVATSPEKSWKALELVLVQEKRPGKVIFSKKVLEKSLKNNLLEDMFFIFCVKFSYNVSQL